MTAALSLFSFSRNRDRLLKGEIAAKLLSQPRVKRLLSCEHFLGRGHADRGLRLDQELQAEGPPGRRAERQGAKCAVRMFDKVKAHWTRAGRDSGPAARLR